MIGIITAHCISELLLVDTDVLLTFGWGLYGQVWKWEYKFHLFDVRLRHLFSIWDDNWIQQQHKQIGSYLSRRHHPFHHRRRLRNHRHRSLLLLLLNVFFRSSSQLDLCFCRHHSLRFQKLLCCTGSPYPPITNEIMDRLKIFPVAVRLVLMYLKL
ncbi:hypothetical protein SAY87_008423 [Trapa incisa]|uniref:Uncharacterized protein n=1 Tax=Trapa incisa TaxID=236973 RepID=A0AAN7KGP6_9MYRT|nr:hypothetical protein SAY87_008423 [Trapa incisa]